jgi:hypothetical protein
MRIGSWPVRRNVVAAAVIGTVVAIGTAWLLSTGPRGAEIATVLGLTVAVLASVYGASSRFGSEDATALVRAAKIVVREVGGQQAAEQQKFLAQRGHAVPAEIDFSQPDQVYWRTDGGAQRGTLKNIRKFYTGLEFGRLLIIGKAGAGKTVLARLLAWSEAVRRLYDAQVRLLCKA